MILASTAIIEIRKGNKLINYGDIYAVGGNFLTNTIAPDGVQSNSM